MNNSNILLKDCTLDAFFEWCKAHPSRFCGIIDSHDDFRDFAILDSPSYHLQSHFLIFRQDAIPLFEEFFTAIEFERFFEIKDQNELRERIIVECEIGLSQFMIKHGYKPAAWMSAEGLSYKYGKPHDINYSMTMPFALIINEGYPLMNKIFIKKDFGIKRRLIFNFRPEIKKWVQLRARTAALGKVRLGYV